MKKGDVVKVGDSKGTIQWVVDIEIGVLFDSGESAVLDTTATSVELLSESAPVYQTSVDHMTDDQLRASIEELRHKRIAKPIVKRISKTKEEVVEDNDPLSILLKSKTPEQIIAIKRKLGLID
jgi:prolyl-tRNA synthetase